MEMASVVLADDPLRFHPVDPIHAVFFDEANRQVFTLRDAAPEVLVSAVADHSIHPIKFGRGAVMSMKLAPDNRVLALQRTPKTVIFVNHAPGLDTSEYAQGAKIKSGADLLGFNWVSNTEILLATTHGIELFQVVPEKRALRALKSVSQQLSWFSYSAGHNLLLAATSPQANIIMPFLVKKGTIIKMARFEIELPSGPNQLLQRLAERDVIVATIYGRLTVLVLQNSSQPLSPSDVSRAEIQLWHLEKDSVILEHVLRLDHSGRFALNVIDNLVVAHHQVSRTTAVFDVRAQPPPAPPATILYHSPIAVPTSIGGGRSNGPAAEYYSPSWLVFQPDIIIDARMGALWTVDVALAPLSAALTAGSPVSAVAFLLRRAKGKALLMKLVSDIISAEDPRNLAVLGEIFDRINTVCLAAHLKNMDADSFEREFSNIVANQSTMYSCVFAPLEETGIKYKYMVAVLMEYIRSLNVLGLPVPHFLFESVITLLVRHGHFYQLHQFLQYHVVSDSKHVACLLLSLESAYPPAFQLALDMLKRVGTANEEILDVLLSKRHLLSALRFVRALGPVKIAEASAHRFLEAAYATQDYALFYTVFKFFEARNVQLRKSPDFMPGEGCQMHVDHFRRLFPGDVPTRPV